MMQDQTTGGNGSGNGSGSSGGAAAQPAQGAQTNLPLFYTAPRPLHPEQHGGKGLRQPVDYRFAAAAHAVAVHAQEFRLIAAHCPIVFATDDPPMPVAVLGLNEGQNLFVDDAGAWMAMAYIPAYVRRYPFITGPGGGEGRQVVYLDEASDLVVDLDGNPDAAPLFENGEPSEQTRQITDFCAAFDQQVKVTMAFVEEIKGRDLLASRELRLDLPSGGSRALTGVRVIDEQKFNALPDDAFLEWRRQGWIALVHWHWASMDNFLRLAEKG